MACPNPALLPCIIHQDRALEVVMQPSQSTWRPGVWFAGVVSRVLGRAGARRAASAIRGATMQRDGCWCSACLQVGAHEPVAYTLTISKCEPAGAWVPGGISGGNRQHKLLGATGKSC